MRIDMFGFRRRREAREVMARLAAAEAEWEAAVVRRREAIARLDDAAWRRDTRDLHSARVEAINATVAELMAAVK